MKRLYVILVFAVFMLAVPLLVLAQDSGGAVPPGQQATANLSIHKYAETTTRLTVGDKIVYHVSVSNEDEDAPMPDAIATDVLPENVELVEGSLQVTVGNDHATAHYDPATRTITVTIASHPASSIYAVVRFT